MNADAVSEIPGKPDGGESAKAAGLGAAKREEPKAFGEECGGKGGVPYLSCAQASDRIRRVTVWHREYVDSIRLETDEGELPRIGRAERLRDVRQDTFQLAADEFVVEVSVEYWTYIDRLTFHTNKGTYGPYGGEGGRLRRVLTVPPGRRLAGFKGRHWAFVDSIQLMVI
ncbi:MAG TPA: jacalin-like lectin [Verrucomicrobiae bacterium]|nr:jacalin-like lectin [Verrucomicrobiae bacterium]